MDAGSGKREKGVKGRGSHGGIRRQGKTAGVSKSVQGRRVRHHGRERGSDSWDDAADAALVRIDMNENGGG